MRVMVFVDSGLMGIEKIAVLHGCDTEAEVEIKAEDIADELYADNKEAILEAEAEDEDYNFYERWTWDGFPIKEEYDSITDDDLLEEAHRIGIYNFFDIYCETDD